MPLLSEQTHQNTLTTLIVKGSLTCKATITD
jgi:hypothetical protein